MRPLLLLLTACLPTQAEPPADPPDTASVWLGEVPHVRQKPDFCGEACLAMAMARYLMQYLQEQEKLRPFMAAYAANRAADPSGYRTLLEVLEVEDVAAFTEEWQAWALALRRK